MTRIALVSCVKKKAVQPAPARNLYQSDLFLGYRCYAEHEADVWYVLSAEHGLLHPDQVVASYDRTLKRMSVKERREWAGRVQHQLLAALPPHAEVILLAGTRYREGIEPFLRAHGYSVSVPFEGLGLGQQLQRLKQYRSQMSTTEKDLERFYSILARLKTAPHQGERLAEQSRRTVLPSQGVYFFEEAGEYRTKQPDALRIVRVGTHAVSLESKATLWRRLRTHKGTKTGGGNHRGSIFRLHVGAAMLRRERVTLETWGKGSTAPKAVAAGEAEHEAQVSAYICAMRVLWIAVPGPSGPTNDRAYIERNAIALLSNHGNPVDPASSGWLGRLSPQEAIRCSALWNVNHVDEDYDPRFLVDLEARVEETMQCGVAP